MVGGAEFDDGTVDGGTIGGCEVVEAGEFDAVVGTGPDIGGAAA